MRKWIPVVGEDRFVERFQVLVGIEVEGKKHVAALASHFVVAQPHQLFQHRDAWMLAGVGDLSALVVPSAAGFETPFSPKRGVHVPLFFEAPDSAHGSQIQSDENDAPAL